MTMRRKSGILLPAVQSHPVAPSAPERIAGEAALQAFVEALGGRSALLSALEIGSRHAAVDQVLDLLADPRYQSRSLRWICTQAGITAADLFAAFRTAKLAEAQIKATTRIAERIGPIVDDLLTRAAPYEGTCEECGGKGTITLRPTKKDPDPQPQTCDLCRGSGRQIILPDLERQKVALELADLLKKGGGISITQQTMAIGEMAGTKGGDLERLQQAMSGAWDPAPPRDRPVPVVDVESVQD